MNNWLFRRIVPGQRYPLRLFGGFIVVFSGKWVDIRLRKNWLVVIWRKHSIYAYISPDATPSRAVWSIGRYND